MSDTTYSLKVQGSNLAFAADAINSEYHPYSKMEFGASGTATAVSSSNPLPIDQLSGYTVNRVVLNETGADQEVVAAVAGKQIRVIGGCIATAAASGTTVLFESGTTTGITAATPLVQYQPVILPEAPHGHFETASGEALTVTVSTGAVVGWLSYIEVG